MPKYSVEVIEGHPTLIEWEPLKSTRKMEYFVRTDTQEEKSWRKGEVPLHDDKEDALNTFMIRCVRNIENWIIEMEFQHRMWLEASKMRTK